MIRAVAVGAFVALLLAGCSSIEPNRAAEDRAITVGTTSCGDASATNGAGFIIGGELVLTAAHVVIGATDLIVEHSGEKRAATTVRLDTRTDLAILRVPGLAGENVELADAVPETTAIAAGGGPSGSFESTITRLVEVRIEEVRSTVRSSRFGYEIDRRVELGDSGGAMFDESGRITGVIFGRSTINPDRSFVVRAEEIELILDAPDSEFVCDPAQHRVIERRSS